MGRRLPSVSFRIQGETVLLRPFREQEAATLWELHPVTGIAFAVKPK